MPASKTVTPFLQAVALVSLVAGCAAPAADGIDDAEHSSARAAAADVARGLDRDRTDLIDDYARWADEDTADTAVELIGFTPYEGAAHGEPVGSLQFRSTVQFAEYGDPYVACFESEFNFWGVAFGPGGWDDDAAVSRDIACPADAQRIAPPVDTRPIRVVPEGAEALVVEVLTNAPPEASVDDILGEVLTRMPQPTGEREVAFEPNAVVIDGEIGFAMGDADDCLLVNRTADGVQVLYPPRVLLQPGELGCLPDTALAGEQLRPPH